MLKFEARPEASRLMSIASPLLALAITVVIGTCLFMLLGKDPLKGLYVFFIEPVKSMYALSELAMKATPLLLIALGLAVCFRSNVWNIGAEGSAPPSRMIFRSAAVRWCWSTAIRRAWGPPSATWPV